ncbi:hypothetical protein C8R47DRAFT_1300873 [Mycena vitilis]|nr:hypothetical protein C8R47DRAFT_1300873 [Mycena vitilis]
MLKINKRRREEKLWRNCGWRGTHRAAGTGIGWVNEECDTGARSRIRRMLPREEATSCWEGGNLTDDGESLKGEHERLTPGTKTKAEIQTPKEKTKPWWLERELDVAEETSGELFEDGGWLAEITGADEDRSGALQRVNTAPTVYAPFMLKRRYISTDQSYYSREDILLLRAGWGEGGGGGGIVHPNPPTADVSGPKKTSDSRNGRAQLRTRV